MTRACFSTHDLPQSAKVSYWNDLTTDVFTPLEIKPARPAEFNATLTSSEFGGIALARPQSPPALVRHSKSHVQRLRERKFFLHMPVQGEVVATCGDEEMLLRQGDMLLCDSARPYSFAFDQASAVLIAILSAEQLQRHLPAPEAAAGLRIEGSRGFGRTASAMLSNLWDAAGEEDLPAPLCERASNDFLSVFATACAAHGLSTSATGARTARRMEVRRYIDEHLADPELSAGAVADALGLSRRYLHMLFDAEDETVGGYILRRRLEACARQLGDPLLQRRSITDVAFSWGFNHPVHFARVFRQRFGLSPSNYRAERLAAGELRRAAGSALA